MSSPVPAPAGASPGATPAARFRGIPVVPGVAYGPAVVARAVLDPDAMRRFATRRLTAEEAIQRYDAAVAVVSGRLADRAARASGSAAELLTATAGLARDPGLRSAVVGRVAGSGLLGALADSIDQFAELFTTMGGLMAERVTDLRDLQNRLTAEIVGEPEPGVPAPQVPGVLVTEDLAPADAAGLDPDRVLALVIERGGPSSHTAVIARQLGIPCVVAAAGVGSIGPGSAVLVDGATGEVEVAPDADEARRRVRQAAERRTHLEAWVGPGRTQDGTPVRLLANVADVGSAVTAAHGPVEGCGLFRTELSFLNRTDEPTVEEQAELYAGVLDAFGPGRTVVVRTLDARADKPVAFATGAGRGPALAVRGLRLPVDDPGLLERQLAAVAAAARSTGTEPWVMAPMVATVAQARGFAARVHDLGLRAGVMVEVPSAALLADRLLEHVDFLSVGTNDLAQYAMAADRTGTDLAHLTDPWQPAVLRLVAMTAAAGTAAGKPVGVCGEAAADPLLAVVLVGMGVTSLSMAAAAVPPVGVQLAAVTRDRCEAAAEAALEATDPAAGRAAVRALLIR